MSAMIDPPWMAYARSKLGIHEIPGYYKNNEYIVECLKDAGVSAELWYDETAWCGSFGNKCLKETGHRGPPGPAAARHWALPCKQLVQIEHPVHGCILVFSRPPNPKHGHMGFYEDTGIDDDDNHYYNVLGGNEDNSVKIKLYPKVRYIGSFWPADYPLPEGAKLFQHPVA